MIFDLMSTMAPKRSGNKDYVKLTYNSKLELKSNSFDEQENKSNIEAINIYYKRYVVFMNEYFAKSKT